MLRVSWLCNLRFMSAMLFSRNSPCLCSPQPRCEFSVSFSPFTKWPSQSSLLLWKHRTMNFLRRGIRDRQTERYKDRRTDRQTHRKTERVTQFRAKPCDSYVLAVLLCQSALARPGDVWSCYLLVCQKKYYSDSHLYQVILLGTEKWMNK